MSTEIWVALISLLGIIASGVLSALVSNKLINHRLESLERKVDEHNGYAKKFGNIEISITAINKDIEYIKKAVDKENK